MNGPTAKQQGDVVTQLTLSWGRAPRMRSCVEPPHVGKFSVVKLLDASAYSASTGESRRFLQS